MFVPVLLVASTAQTQQLKLRSLRVDPSYFYNLYPGSTVQSIAADVVSKAKAAGANALVVTAYNSTYGAFYKTTYNLTTVESGYGAANIFKELTLAAKSQGLITIASVPVNNFKKVWDSKQAWRAKMSSGADYIPASNQHLLCVWHSDFRTWLGGFYDDLLLNNPNVDGIEAVEPYIDYNWMKESDYNSAATKKFKSSYPGGKLGDANWLKLRAQGLTDLIAIMNTKAAKYGKKTFLVQTWPVKSDGTMYSADFIRDNIGLDFDGILNLTGTNKLNYLTGEFMWQMWAAEYVRPVYSPYNWTRQVAGNFISFVAGRSISVIHLEISPFWGTFGYVAPNDLEFADSLSAVKDLNAGIDVYDFSQIFVLGTWSTLTTWN